MDAITESAVKTAMSQLLSKDYFEICTIDKTLRALNIPKQDATAYNTLSLMHCVDYANMDKVIRESIPTLIDRVFGMSEEQQVEESYYSAASSASNSPYEREINPRKQSTTTVPSTHRVPANGFLARLGVK